MTILMIGGRGMDNAGLFREVHRNYRGREVQRVKEGNKDQWSNLVFVDRLKNYSALKQELSKYGMDIKKLWFVGNMGFGDLYYIDGYMIMNMGHMTVIEMGMLKPGIVERLKSDVDRAVQAGELIEVWFRMPEQLRFWMYYRNYDRLSVADRVRLAEQLYVASYYPFDVLEVDKFKRDVKKGRYVKQLAKYADKDGYITIYRGEINGSTPIKKAISYTIKREVAERFARGFNQQGIVYRARVHINDVRMFTGECEDFAREEWEVVAFYEDIKDIKRIK